ncbi:MAG: 3-dehydroquinate synthase [Pseudomonadota bacterium]
MKTLQVSLGERSYPIQIGQGLLTQTDYRAWLSHKHVIVVTNTTVAPLYLQSFKECLEQQGMQVDTVILPDGEAYKTMDTLNVLLTRLLEIKAERKTTLFALGGGVIGDIVGFAAAIYLRGIPFIQVPTTLLSQVDSSVGGKTAVNHPLGKNMVGCFYQPKAVVIDTSTLQTLPEREFSAGLAEVIKYGLIRDRAFLEWLDKSMKAIWAQDNEALSEAIYRSCQYKADIVAEDESELGVRALLNLGHTFGHAIETGMGYGAWLHGEAVGAGTLMAAELSHQAGWLTQGDVEQVRHFMQLAHLPLKGPQLGADRYIELMQNDKKVENGDLRLILLKALGQAEVVTWKDSTLLKRVIESCCDA